MMHRYHHGHSTALGFLLALSLQRHALLLLAGAFLVGLVAGRTWGWWLGLAGQLRARLLGRPAPAKAQGRAAW